MTLTDAGRLTKAAQADHYAVGAFNLTSIAAARGVVAAAEQEHSPVILQVGQRQLQNYVPLNLITPALLALAESASVPVALHLDHANDMAVIQAALEAGFTSVMIDASTLPLAANITQVRQVIEMAKPYHAAVEAEIGPMRREGVDQVDYAHLDLTYTSPKEAKTFVDATHPDMLAVAYGTVHGIYSQTPHLNFALLRELADTVEPPLVVHGGSGLADEDYRRSIQNGITKVNYFSTLASDTAEHVRAKLNAAAAANTPVYLPDLDNWSTAYMKDAVAAKLRVFGSAGRA